MIVINCGKGGTAKPIVENYGVVHCDVGSLEGRLQGVHSELSVARQAAHESDPCGFGIWRSLSDLGWEVQAATPTLLSKLLEDRVKTDHRAVARYYDCSVISC